MILTRYNMNSISNDAFETVLNNFKQNLNQKQIQNFQFVTLNDVRETAIRIQHQQEQTKTMMNMTRIESFIEAMDQFGKVIEVFLNASGFVAFIWGPMKFLLQIASTWTESFEALLDAYSQLGEHIPLLQQYDSLFEGNSDMRRALVLVYSDILEFHQRAIHFFSGKAWKQIFRSIWKNFRTRFKQILDNLSRHRQLISEQATVINFQKQHLFFEQYELDREERRRKFEKQEEEDLRKKYIDVLEWFSAARSTVDDQNTFYQSRAAGTGEWILKEEKVHNWMEVDVPESSILWLNGIPGAGKTILASIVINACPVNSTVYFYCKESDPEKNSCISILRGLLSQLLNQHKELVPYCYDKMNATGENGLTTLTLAENLLKTFFEKAPSLRIIIDGLDECNPDQRKLLLSFLTGMVDHCDQRDPGILRLLLISQDYPDIAKSLKLATTLRLTDKENKSDITTYIGAWSKTIQQKYNLHVDTVEEIRESTCARSKGMFLFAKLVMEHLFALETKIKVLDEIKRYGFPNGLEDAYERIIRRLKQSLQPEQWRIACKLFGWMVCAKRTLNWREIQAAVSMNPDHQTFEFEDRKLRSSIQEYCGSLIQVSPGNRVELVHATAKMHIASSQYIDKLAVEYNLAALCLRYLTFDIFDSDISEQHLRHFIGAGYLSFQDYAVAKWFEHLRAIITTRLAISSADQETQAAVKDIAIALEDFLIRYGKDLSEYDISFDVERDCKSFQNYAYYNDLLVVWNHAIQHAKKDPAAVNDISIKVLGDAVMRNRKLLERITFEVNQQPGESANMQDFYGDRRFKCSKVTCYYFHEGFKRAEDRDQHINRHDRPFICTFPDCSIAEFGFSSNKDLEKHRRFFHPEMEERVNLFGVVSKPTAAATPFECNVCGKKFTRRMIFKDHMLSHTGTRPHACGECGKAFTRANDCRRHERIHERHR